jgi:rubrerythrin
VHANTARMEESVKTAFSHLPICAYANIARMEEIMGIFDRFKKKEITHEEQLMNDIDNVLEEKKLKLEEININNKEQRDQYVKFCCDQIKIARKELSDAKQEYNLVTTYLSDIQQIEELPLNNKAEVTDLAREIVNLSDERKSFQNNRFAVFSDRIKRRGYSEGVG